MLNSELRLESSLKLAPQMQYSLSILQMNTETLASHIKEQAMTNPIIDIESLSSSSSQTVNMNFTNDIPAKSNEQTLLEFLREQIPTTLSTELIWVLNQLIDMLDPSGFLRISPVAIIESLKISSDLFESALFILHQFDPPGIGAFSLQECLLIQLKRQETPDSLACCIIENYLEDVASGKLRKIAKKEKVPLQHVEQAIQHIRTLSPRPANGYFFDEKTEYITPDISVQCKGETFNVAVTVSLSSALKRNPVYEDLLLRLQDNEIQKYLKEKFSEYTRLELAVAMRTKTLLAIANIIVSKHENFFRYGHLDFPPLSLEDISQKLNIHISTVSRAIQNKYLICDWGLFPLKKFLSRHTISPTINPESCSLDQACQAIKNLICDEDKSVPLSDNQIIEKLRENGIVISRRTVVNYRDKLGIPSSYARKERNIK